jgi:tetratricopeptide (TPR) repeat protein
MGADKKIEITESSLTTIATSDADKAISYIQEAALLFKEKKYKEALPLYDKAIAIWPYFDDAHEKRGQILIFMNKYSEALESLELALQLNPSNMVAMLNKGIAQFRLEKIRDAIETFDKVIEDQKPKDAYMNRGILYFEKSGKISDEKSDYLKALANFRLALELDPKDIKVIAWIEKCLLKFRDQKKELARLYNMALKAEPNDSKRKEYRSAISELTGVDYRLHVNNQVNLCRILGNLGIFPPEIKKIIEDYLDDPVKESGCKIL